MDPPKVALAAIALACFVIGYRGQISSLRERRARRRAERAALLLDSTAYLITVVAIGSASILLGIVAFGIAAISSFPSFLIGATGGPDLSP